MQHLSLCEFQLTMWFPMQFNQVRQLLSLAASHEEETIDEEKYLGCDGSTLAPPRPHAALDSLVFSLSRAMKPPK